MNFQWYISSCAHLQVYGTAALDFCLLNTFSSRYQFALGMALTAYSIVVTIVYLMIRDPAIHQAAYALLVSISVFVPLTQVGSL